MVLKDAVDNLKERPKDERKAVAGGIAIAIVALLFFGWAFLFLKKLQKGGVAEDLRTGAPSDFNFSSVEEAQQKLIEGYTSRSADEEELRAIREQSQRGQGVQTTSGDTGQPTDPFRNAQ